MITVVSWNIAMRPQAVEELLARDADVALPPRGGPGRPGGPQRSRR